MKSVVLVVGDGAVAITKFIDCIRKDCNINDTFSLINISTNESFDGTSFCEEYLSLCDDISTIGLVCGCFTKYTETLQVLIEIFTYFNNCFHSIPIVSTLILNNAQLLTGYESIYSLLLCYQCLKYSELCILRTTNDAIELCKVFCENNATTNQSLNSVLKSQNGYLSVIACDIISIYINNNQQYNSLYPLQNVSKSNKIFDIRSSLPLTYLNKYVAKSATLKRSNSIANGNSSSGDSCSGRPIATLLMRNLSNNLNSLYDSTHNTEQNLSGDICINAAVLDVYQGEKCSYELATKHQNRNAIVFKHLTTANATLFQLAMPTISLVTLNSNLPTEASLNKIIKTDSMGNEGTVCSLTNVCKHKYVASNKLDFINPLYEHYSELCASSNNDKHASEESLTSGLYGVKKTSAIMQSKLKNMPKSSDSHHLMTILCFESYFSKRLLQILIKNATNVISDGVAYAHVLYQQAYHIPNEHMYLKITREHIEDACHNIQKFI